MKLARAPMRRAVSRTVSLASTMASAWISGGCRAEVELVLARPGFVMTAQYLDAARVELVTRGAQHFAADAAHPVEIAAVVDGAAVVVEHVELELGRHRERRAERSDSVDDQFERSARVAGPGLGVGGAHVAGHPADTATDLSQRRTIGPQPHVRLEVPGPTFERRAVEHDTVRERIVEARTGQHHRVDGAEHVDEGELDPAQVVLGHRATPLHQHGDRDHDRSHGDDDARDCEREEG